MAPLMEVVSSQSKQALTHFPFDPVTARLHRGCVSIWPPSVSPIKISPGIFYSALNLDIFTENIEDVGNAIIIEDIFQSIFGHVSIIAQMPNYMTTMSLNQPW